MEKFITLIVIIHVCAGILALIFGAIAFGLRKNTPKHKPIGRIYFYCMSVIFVTGIFLSIVRATLFFFFIAIFTYYTTVMAYRSLRLKNIHKGQKYLWFDWFIQVIAGLTFMGLSVIGILIYINHHSSNALIPLTFGAMGLFGVYRNIRRMIAGPKETNYWLKIHIGNMIGSYIGAITAFIVNQSGHIPVNPVILWLGPTLIILPVMISELKKVKTQALVN